MSEPQTQALTKPKPQTLTLRHQLESEAFKQQVARALPKHLTPDRFIRVAATAIMRIPKLADCDQVSFFNSLLTLSQLGLEPDGRRAHLIPFNNRKRNVVECQLIIDYKGLAELAMRSGVVSYLHADVVCDQDAFEYDRGQIQAHKIDFRKPRGDAYAVYALCRFKDGSEKCDVMSVEEVESVRARSRAGNDGPWVTDWREMAKKTVFRRLSKWLPLSPEFRDAIDADDESSTEVTSSRIPEVKSPSFLSLPPETPAPAPAPDAKKARKVLPAQQKEEPAAETAPPEEDNAPFDTEPAAEDDSTPPATPPVPAATAAKHPTLVEEQLTPQEQLMAVLKSNLYTFDDLKAWGADTGFIEKADSLASVDDLPVALARRLLENQRGLMKQLQARSAVAAGGGK